MSLQFNDTTNFRGIVQIYEKECGFNRGDISGTASKLKEFTADANLAFDDLLTIGFKKSGRWQLDDTNYTDYPIIRTNLVASQRDYGFLAEANGALILDVHRVMVADASGVFYDLVPKDQQTRNGVNDDTTGFVDGRNVTGKPNSYDKTGNAIFLDPIPNYSYTNGLKIFINREPSYFAYDDTTKKPGVPGNLHRWFAIKPAADYCRRKGKKNARDLAIEVQKLETLIGETFSMRQRDYKGNISMAVENCE